MDPVVRPHETGDQVAAVLHAREAGLRLALATSGTTGRHREVIRSTESWWCSFGHYGELAQVSAGSRLWVPGPARSTMNLFALVHARVTGAAVVGRPEDADAACLTPSQLDRSLTQLTPGTSVVVAGAALPAALARRAAERDIVLHHYYGAAELSFVAWADGNGLRAFPGVQIETRDVPVERTIWVRSPYVCDGYAGTRGSMRTDPDGWASVGDVGTVNDGVLTVLGRPDAIVTAGSTVLVADVEAELRGVAHGDFAVHSTPHAVLGHVVTVTLVDPEDRVRLQQWAQTHLPPSHRPRRWRVVPQLPLTAAGKVDRSRLTVVGG